MSTSQDVIFVPGMSTDHRIRTFRRNFSAPGEFEDMEVDAYVIVTERYVVVCDTLLCPADMAAVLHEVGDTLAGRQLLVINSHADWDHCWGNRYFSEALRAPIIAHELCRRRLQSEVEQKKLAHFQQRDPLFEEVRLVPPTITFMQTLTIDGGDLTLVLKAAPGHTEDHIALWIPQVRLLLAFDAVEKPLPIIESADRVPDMFATLESLRELQPQQVLCSHGKTSSPAMITTNLHYLRDIERRCQALLHTHRPTDAELMRAPALINYTFDDALADLIQPGEMVDRAFYEEIHDNNVRYIMQWLCRRQAGG
jgi:glyoxylase-like metal-dependent hydrolase (beta-lactamase superfamily II)